MAMELPGMMAPVALIQGVMNQGVNNEAQRRNREKLEQLLALESQGELGLSGQQKQSLDQQYNAPVAAAAQAAQSRAERIAATAGDGASGADLARLRGEAAGTRAEGAQNAAMQIAALNQAEEMRKANEIEQRLGLKTAMRRDDYDTIFGALAPLFGAAGQMAGAPPSMAGATGVPPDSAPAGAPLPGGEELPATGAPAEAAGDAASEAAGGAAEAFARSGRGGETQGQGQLTEPELKEFEELARTDPNMFRQIFLATMAKKRGSTSA